MSIEVRPVGVTCNLRCSYCYEQPVRDIEPVKRYNKEKVLAELQHVESHWSLFGGEALILPLNELEELLSLAHTRWGQSGIQTNATLITPAHIDLFDKYNTHVGISLDGPGELNDSRWAGTLDATRKLTERTHAAIDMLLTAAKERNKPHLVPSLIVTLHAGNASVDRWPRMKDWFVECDKKGIKSINVHLMELDYEATKTSEWYLPHDRLKQVMFELWELSSSFTCTQIANFSEFLRLLRGSDNTMCVWHACDPWNTSAVQGLEGDGAPSHCTRTNKDGIEWLPAEGMGLDAPWQIGTFKHGKRFHERQLSLYVTPQEHGGCKGCRFWALCMGHCPGTAEESHGEYGDWRLRSTYCQTWKDMLEEGERRLLAVGEQPISRHPKLNEIEQVLYAAWINNTEIPLSRAIQVAEGKMPFSAATLKTGNGHGDHWDDAIAKQPGPHGDHTDAGMLSHGDHTDQVPHGDHTDAVQPSVEHGDHTDVPSANREHGDSHGDEHGDHTDNVPHGDHTDRG